ncbi:GntR family transcriptional regulator [Streptomyces winkii]|uniref:GntR family transcriptional regulator n=1 Tax=Streptomyces winkii TaxID=3051178 RepID=UPI0028D897C9|nr:GntR family transcriptional regulator [Streptomyces sp. DSM 40971]
MEQTAADAPVRAGRAALHPHRPHRPAPAGEQHPAGADDDQGARGEHVHSEPPPPQIGGGTRTPADTRREPDERAGTAQVPDSRTAQVPDSRPPAESSPGRHRRPRQTKQPERHSVRAQVLAALREALLSGELAPGEVYSAPALAESLGVSATPVREAMQRLVCEGAVETVPNRGFRIAVCSDRDLAELAEIRVLLEIPSVLETARTMPPECWESLRPYADETLAVADLGDRAAYADADCAFHCALLELTGNRQLVAIAADIQRRAQRRPAPTAPSLRTQELVRDASDHMALLDALRTRDLTTVERLMRAHVTA